MSLKMDRGSVLLRQAGWAGSAVLNLPAALGARGHRLQLCPPPDRPVDPAGHAPVVLVHGYAASVDCWTPLVARLGAEAFDRVFVFGYNGLSADLPDLGQALARAVTSVLGETGGQGVHLVGHSLGGLVVRLAAEWGGLWASALTVATIATPHRGSALAWLAPGQAARWMRSGRAALPDPVFDRVTGGPRYLNFHCSRDAVLTQRSARLEVDRVTNIELPDVGHLGATRADALLATLPDELVAGERSRLLVPGTGAGPDGAIDRRTSVPA
jgi:pimeloyl-ACP methyl ester carboxylesterase